MMHLEQTPPSLESNTPSCSTPCKRGLRGIASASPWSAASYSKINGIRQKIIHSQPLMHVSQYLASQINHK
jgi:hypothetical protein